MIEITKDKPEGLFDTLKDPHTWIRGEFKGKIYGWMALYFGQETAVIHLEILTWSHNIYKEMFRDWDRIKAFCIESGYQTLIASTDIKADDPVFDKFIQLAGFPPPVMTKMSIMEIGEENG